VLSRAGELDRGELQAIVTEVVSAQELIHDTFERRDLPGQRQAWQDACQRGHDANARFEAFVDAVAEPLRRDEPGGVPRAVDFLECDPWCFRSGYAKGRLLRRLTSQQLTSDEQNRLVDVVVSYVDHGGRIEFRDATRLGRRLGGARLRTDLRQRLHANNPGIARRALLALLDMRHPRLSPGDITVARRMVLAELARPSGPWWSYAKWPERIVCRLDPAGWLPELMKQARQGQPDADAALIAISEMSNLTVSDSDRQFLVDRLLDNVTNGGTDRWIEGVAALIDSTSLRETLDKLADELPDAVAYKATWAVNHARRRNN
jgi:hypothetical protein